MAGLGWAVKLGKDIPFLGREALVEQAEKPLPRLLAGFTVDDPDVVLLGRETIYRDGRRCGWLSSAGFGYTVGRSLGYGYVRDPDGVDAAYVMAGSLRARGRDRARPGAALPQAPLRSRQYAGARVRHEGLTDLRGNRVRLGRPLMRRRRRAHADGLDATPSRARRCQDALAVAIRALRRRRDR